jgi:hypothetical protein
VDKEGQKVRRTRIDVEEFGAGIGIAAGVKGGMERDEVECLLANMIYKVRVCCRLVFCLLPCPQAAQPAPLLSPFLA